VLRTVFEQVILYIGRWLSSRARPGLRSDWFPCGNFHSFHISADSVVQVVKAVHVSRRLEGIDGNLGNEPAEDIKFVRAHFAIENLRGIGICHQRHESSRKRNRTYLGNRVRRSSLQKIDHSERQCALREFQLVSPESETALLPVRHETRQAIRRAIEHADRIRPQTQMWICWQDAESLELLGERNNIIGNDGAATLSEYGSGG